MARVNPPHPLYNVWMAMTRRCRNTQCQEYPRYGGRGIKVCERWLEFKNFVEDMGPKPDELQRWTVEREDVDGDYEPGNCKWATYKEQNSNRRDNQYVLVQGQRVAVTEGSRLLGIPRASFQRYVKAQKQIQGVQYV